MSLTGVMADVGAWMGTLQQQFTGFQVSGSSSGGTGTATSPDLTMPKPVAIVLRPSPVYTLQDLQLAFVLLVAGVGLAAVLLLVGRLVWRLLRPKANVP
jgi:hypothetical protein